MFESFFAVIFQQYGAAGLTFVLILLIIFKWGDVIFARIYKMFKFRSDVYLKPADVLKTKLTYWTSFKIKNLSIADPGRKEIFTDLLTIHFNTISENIFLLDQDANKPVTNMNNSELYEHFMEVISKIHNDYTNRAMQEGIPLVVLDKYKEWNSQSLEYTMRSGAMILSSGVYSGGNANMDKVQAIYALFAGMLEVIIAEAERTLSSLNGQLTGVTYKGVVCG